MLHEGEGLRVKHSLAQRAVAEGLGTAMLLATVVGSGVMAERLAGGNVALALLANAVATGAGLVVLIATFAQISGAHLNPVVTLVEGVLARRAMLDVLAYLVAQVSGAIAGVWLAHAMFGLAIAQMSTKVRADAGQWISEVVATFGLVLTIQAGARTPDRIPVLVGLYITAAYWFTASTSFANPAVTLARTLTDTFTGIRAADAPGFIVAQVVGAGAAAVLWSWLGSPRQADTVEIS